jgi:predicted metallopeptidase
LHRPRAAPEFTGFAGRIEQDRADERIRPAGLEAPRRGTVAAAALGEGGEGVLQTVERAPKTLPPVLRWHEPDRPLPLRPVRLPPGARPRALGLEAPPWLDTGPAGVSFDFCARVGRLCADVVARCPELEHIDVSRLLFAVTQARNGQRHGLQARVTPLRFRHGELVRRRQGVTYQVQRYVVDGRDMLYLVTFCLPRFLDQSFDDKFITLFHELYHISPAFEGDLRRLGGRCAVHSHSKRAYDAHMAQLARAYLAGGADPALHAFLRMDFAQLAHRHGSVVGVFVPRPRLLPLPDAARKG